MANINEEFIVISGSERVKEALRSISNKMIENKERRAECLTHESRSLEREIPKVEKQEAKYVKKYRFWKGKFGQGYIIALTILGMFMGIILGIRDILEYHGPTVTILGTLGAYVLYTVAGILFSVPFNMIGRMSVQDYLNDYRQKIEACREAKAEIIRKIDEYETEVEEIRQWNEIQRKILVEDEEKGKIIPLERSKTGSYY